MSDSTTQSINEVTLAVIVSCSSLFVTVIPILWLSEWQVFLFQSNKANSRVHSTGANNGIDIVIQAVQAILPIELRKSSRNSWFHRFLHVANVEHSWLALKSSYQSCTHNRLYNWLMAMGRILHILFIGSILISVYYADDGFCESKTTIESCYDSKSEIFNSNVFYCEWMDHSCHFSKRLNQSYFVIVVLSCIIICACVILDNINRLFAFQLCRYTFRFQSSPLNIIEYNAPVVETYNQMHYLCLMKNFNASPIEQLNFERKCKDMYQENILLEIQLMSSSQSFLSSVINHIIIARMVSSKYQFALQRLNDPIHREIHLFRLFLLNQIATYQSFKYNVANKYLFRDYIFNSTFTSWISTISIIIYPVYLGLIMFLTIWYGASIGSHVTSLWLEVCFMSIGLDILILQFTMIWIKCIVIPSLFINDLQAMLSCVCSKLNSILCRDFDDFFHLSMSMIQHMNPACRVASSVSSLFMAKLLLCLRDSDIPVPAVYQKRVFSLPAIFSRLFLWDVSIELLLTLIIGLLMIFVAILSSYSNGMAIGFVLGMIGIFLLTTFIAEYRKAKVTRRVGFVKLPNTQKLITNDNFRLSASLQQSINPPTINTPQPTGSYIKVANSIPYPPSTSTNTFSAKELPVIQEDNTYFNTLREFQSYPVPFSRESNVLKSNEEVPLHNSKTPHQSSPSNRMHTNIPLIKSSNVFEMESLDANSAAQDIFKSMFISENQNDLRQN